MTPSERRQYQAVNGTDYAGQFRDQVLDLAFIGGYEDKDGNLWHYSPRKSDIGAWMKMYDNSPFGYYRTASGDGAFKVGASWLDVSERWVGAGYNAWLERYKWAQRTYGGTGDGSILDQLHQSFSNFNTKYNPVAHLVNGIDGIAFGTDRFGNQQSGIQTTTQLASGIVGIFGPGIAKGISGAVVGEAQIAASGSQLTLGPGLKLADNKLIQHAHQWGIAEKGVGITKDQMGLMRKLATHIYKNANTIRQGSWGNPAAGGFSDALYYSNGKHIVITQSNGTMITILRNAMGNKHFNNATTIFTKQ